MQIFPKKQSPGEFESLTVVRQETDIAVIAASDEVANSIVDEGQKRDSGQHRRVHTEYFQESTVLQGPDS